MNIYDIAEKCGVSIATVSRVLNNNPNVSAATRAKIQAVMDEENYSPNAFARSLGSGNTRMVGVLCADIRDSHYAGMVSTLEAQLRQRNLPVLLRCSGLSAEEEKQALEAMVNSKVDAILMVGSAPREDAQNDPIRQAAKQVPVILLDSYVDDKNVHCVTSDQRGVVMDLVAQLMGRQRRRILFLRDQLTYSCQQKIDGYLDALAAAGVEPDPSLIVAAGQQMEDVNNCIKQLLINRVTFDAVIGAEDLLALGAQKSLGRTGLNMPIIGFGNSLAGRYATPELTTVDTAPEELCAAGIRMLDDLLAGKEVTDHVIIPAHLIQRDTFRNT